jgi:PAS domain S-box-containing protein
MITVASTMSLFRPPLQARDGGPTPGDRAGSPPVARSPDVSDKQLVLFYEDDAQLMDVLGTFMASALLRGDGVVVIATDEHRARLEELLETAGVDVAGAADRGRYVSLDASRTLGSIMEGDRPSADRFDRVIGEQIRRLVARFTRVRAFGEMVGLLSTDGNTEAALRLEALWNALLDRSPVELLSAYPASSVRKDATALRRICAERRSAVVAAEPLARQASPEGQLKALVRLGQKAEALEREVARREATEDELSNLLENSLEGICTLAPDGRVIWANDALLLLLGYRSMEFVGHHLGEFFTDAEVMDDVLGQLSGGIRTLTTRARLVGRAGRAKHVLVHAHGIYLDGALVRSRWFMLDETPVMAVERDTALLAAIVDSSDDAIISKDLDSRITSWNRGAQRIFGYGEQEVLGKSVMILMPPDRIAEEPLILQRIRAGERVEHYETVRLHKDGHPIHISLTVSPVRDWSGTIVGASNISRDITERRRSEQLLHRAEERYGRLASMLPVGVFACEASGAITYFNSHAQKLWGRAPRIGEEKLSGSLGLHRPDSDMPLAYEDSPVAVAFRERRSVSNVQLIVKRPRGERVTLLMNVDFLDAENGDEALVVGVIQDVTPIMETQRALAQQKQSLETLLEVLPVGVLIAHDPECRHISGNREAERILRATPGENLSKSAGADDGPRHFTIMKNDEVVPDDMLPVQRAAKGEVVVAEELDLVFADGSVVHEMCWARPIYDHDGEPAGAIGCVMDVTELKQNAIALQEADRRKDEFLATLAHELRNPLAPIMAGLDIMEMATDPETLDRTRRTMERQAHQLASLVDDLLDVSRITTGKFQLRKHDVDLAEVLQVALDSTRPAIAEHGHRLAVELPAAPLWVHADPNRLAQVFSNLLDNAVKYTSRGGRIVVRAATEGQVAKVTVTDTGIGIPADKLDLIFEKFIQIDRPQERGYPGLGIGLTLVKAVVELLGGSVSVASPGIDEGATTFTVTLPLVDAPADADRAQRAQRLGNLAPSEVRRVLVVDDNEAMLESLGMVVGLLGHEVMTASDGASAIEIAEEFRPHFVLMDLGMPRMNGYEAARRIRERPWSAGVKLIALTGWGQDEHRRRTETVGFDRHVVKPVRQEDLERLFAER